MEYVTKTKLILPFDGELMVSNGGRTEEANNHVEFASGDGPKNQIYGYDFRLGYTGDGKRLEDHPAFGRKVLAPGDGVVVQVIDGAIDVLPGERDRGVGVGNMIIIEHGNGEWSLICHLQYQSIRVRVGEKVLAGNEIGLCGNTGNTSQPHIHFSLQDGPRMHLANGLPAQFSEILVNGERKTTFEPLRKDVVSNI